MNHRLLIVAINSENDVVDVRRRARHVAQLLGFGMQDQVRIATAVSEIARNAFTYASGGRAEFYVEQVLPSPALSIQVKDCGKGIPNLPEILAGGYKSTTGLGVGILGARRLMDSCDIETEAGRGTKVTLKKLLPESVSVNNALLATIGTQLSNSPMTDTVAEAQLQNRELLQTLAELRTRQDELLALTRELEDTNRGVVALYAEIEEKANHLRRADEMKSRFLSNTSHELRTPLGSIRALAQLLLERIDGDLTAEQEKQVLFIRNAASELSELVNDLLDMAKIEAGKIDIKTTVVDINELFSTLRGMLRPLGVGNPVDLIFEETHTELTLLTDEGKVSQILRNLISNALKFTKSGEVRVTAACNERQHTVRFSVADTGIGIAAADMQLIFEEFGQVENVQQQHAQGTGLGLPLCRRLATLLGGTVEVQSTPGRGSTFSLVLPLSLPLSSSNAASNSGTSQPSDGGCGHPTGCSC
jgi:signal transduction histidine kinase